MILRQDNDLVLKMQQIEATQSLHMNSNIELKFSWLVQRFLATTELRFFFKRVP